MTRQAGVALLAMLLLVLTAASYLLLNKLNGHTNRFVRAADSQRALKQAKQALLAYAMNYPELHNKQLKGPGFLPCPDQDNDGQSDPGGCSSSGRQASIGRLPFRLLGIEDVRDSHGERLWYVVSNNFINRQSDYTIINSETPGLLSMAGVDDIVVIIIAPGAPVAGQTERARPGNINSSAYYLEHRLAAGDALFGRMDVVAAAESNDQLITITRAELMAMVGRRVLSEVRHALQDYTAAGGDVHYAYPWLVPFADPNADYRTVRGQHRRPKNSTCLDSELRTTRYPENSDCLEDSRRNFIAAGVAVHDIVRNTTDGSVGVVVCVGAHELIIAGLSLGQDNDFDQGDAYYIHTRKLSAILSGTATADSGGLLLADDTRASAGSSTGQGTAGCRGAGSDKGFKEIVIPGDVVENTTDGSHGVIEFVTRDMLAVKRLGGGEENDFDPGDNYTIRSNASKATAGSAGLALEDGRANFTAMGVRSGDVIENISDGSHGNITRVGDSTLHVDALAFGHDNSFQADDSYRVSRYNSVPGTRHGLLPVHEPGRRFASAFRVDYSVRQADGNLLIAAVAGPEHLALLQSLKASLSTAGTIAFTAPQGSCIWTIPAIVECSGRGAPLPYPAGDGRLTVRYLTHLRFKGEQTETADDKHIRKRTVCLGYGKGCTLAPANTALPYYDMAIHSEITPAAGLTLTDSLINFERHGVVAGDVLINETTGAAGIIQAVADNTLTVYGQSDNDAPYFKAGDEYRITRPVIAAEVYDDSGAVVARAGLVVPAAGAGGYLRVTGLDYYLSQENGELPAWFIKNRWHTLVYVAYSAGFVPGAKQQCDRAGITSAVADCLTVQGTLATTDTSEVVVLSAGMALAGHERASGRLADYYEGYNATADNLFQQAEMSATFNDQLMVVSPHPWAE